LVRQRFGRSPRTAQQLGEYAHNEGHKTVSVALNDFFSAAVAIAGIYAVSKIGIQS